MRVSDGFPGKLAGAGSGMSSWSNLARAAARHAVVLGVAAVVATAAGCSSSQPAPDLIDGKTPAELRDEAEKVPGRPAPRSKGPGRAGR